MDMDVPELTYSFYKGNVNESEKININNYFEDGSYNQYIPLILKEIYFPISLSQSNYELRNEISVTYNEVIKLLNDLDNQHRQLITAKEYLWDEISKCQKGNYEEKQIELLNKIEIINKYRRGDVKYDKIDILFKGVELEKIWILDLIERMWMAMGVMRKPNYYINDIDLRQEINELDIRLNAAQVDLQKTMLTLSFNNGMYLLSKKVRFKLPYFIINEFKKEQLDKYDKYGTDKYHSNSIDNKCFAIMNYDKKSYFSLSGIDKSPVNVAFNIFFEKNYFNKYKKIDLTENTRYYFNYSNEYIKYKNYKGSIYQKKCNNRMFSCCEQKLIYHTINLTESQLCIFVKYSPCLLCNRIISNVESFEKKMVRIGYGEERDGLSLSSITEYDDIAQKLRKTK